MLIGLLIFICDLVAIVDIASSWRDTEKKLLWILLILLLPFLGMILYFLIGKKRG